MAYELALVATALASSAAAILVLTIQREDRRFPVSPERRALFGLLLLDAAVQWVCIARLQAGRADAAWVASFLLLITANMFVGLLILFRGHALSNLLRWAGVLLLLVLEPLMLGFAIYAIASAGA